MIRQIKTLVFDFLYWVHNISDGKGAYAKWVYPFCASFKTVKRAVDWFGKTYNEWYDFDGLLAWRDGKTVSWGAQRWHSYFDFGLGVRVDDPAILRAKERSGYIFTSFNEAERETSKRQKQMKDDLRNKIKGSIRESLVELKKGKSYVKEIQKQAVEGDRLREARMKAYGYKG